MQIKAEIELGMTECSDSEILPYGAILAVFMVLSSFLYRTVIIFTEHPI